MPWKRILGVVLVLWATMWGGAEAGGWIGTRFYEDRVLAPVPYTKEQIRSMERVSPEAARLAIVDLNLWRQGSELGKAVARMRGTLIGTLVVLAVWAVLAVAWLWTRGRETARRDRWSSA